MKWLLILIGVAVAVWWFKPRRRPVTSRTEPAVPDWTELRGLPPCTLDIDNGGELQDKIIRSIKRGMGDGLTPEMCADRIKRILKTESLQWPSFDHWRDFVRANPDRYASTPIQEQFSDETDYEDQKLSAYVSTAYGNLVCADNIREMKEAGFKNVLWGCRPQDACCDTCARLDRRKIPIDTFMDLYPIHPCCNGMPIADESCLR